MSSGYRFCLLKDSHIGGFHTSECMNDADALIEAGAFLQAWVLSTVEIWNGPRRVGSLSKPTMTTEPATSRRLASLDDGGEL